MDGEERGCWNCEWDGQWCQGIPAGADGNGADITLCPDCGERLEEE